MELYKAMRANAARLWNLKSQTEDAGLRDCGRTALWRQTDGRYNVDSNEEGQRLNPNSFQSNDQGDLRLDVGARGSDLADGAVGVLARRALDEMNFRTF